MKIAIRLAAWLLTGGAGGTLGINAAAKSAPDGYTLLLASVGYPLSIAL